MRAWVGLRLLYCGFGLLRAWGLCSKIMFGLGVWPVGLAQKPGLRGIGLLVYVVKARPGPTSNVTEKNENA
jgi:hypothetical protein